MGLGSLWSWVRWQGLLLFFWDAGLELYLGLVVIPHDILELWLRKRTPQYGLVRILGDCVVSSLILVGDDLVRHVLEGGNWRDAEKANIDCRGFVVTLENLAARSRPVVQQLLPLVEVGQKISFGEFMRYRPVFSDRLQHGCESGSVGVRVAHVEKPLKGLEGLSLGF